jgi:hypothetical protein
MPVRVSNRYDGFSHLCSAQCIGGGSEGESWTESRGDVAMRLQLCCVHTRTFLVLPDCGIERN